MPRSSNHSSPPGSSASSRTTAINDADLAALNRSNDGARSTTFSRSNRPPPSEHPSYSASVLSGTALRPQDSISSAQGPASSGRRSHADPAHSSAGSFTSAPTCTSSQRSTPSSVLSTTNTSTSTCPSQSQAPSRGSLATSYTPSQRLPTRNTSETRGKYKATHPPPIQHREHYNVEEREPSNYFDDKRFRDMWFGDGSGEGWKSDGDVDQRAGMSRTRVGRGAWKEGR